MQRWLNQLRLYTSDSRIRNIGIIAHIDAGKTTTTERMLYYAGFTRRIGEVDRGDTVMDYLPEERERGITISSAAVTFPWRDHQINLIDTPGHVDFSFEVERSLRVLDGGVTILDARSGVQAQTKSVWRQADRHNLPRIVFVNKLDKIGSDYEKCLADVETKLGTPALPLQFPLINDTGIEIVDLVSDKIISWDRKDGSRMSYRVSSFSEKRANLFDKLAQLDDLFLEHYIDNQLPLKSQIQAAIRRLTINRKATPVLCGASFQNVGVQPLLDAVIDYLPPPVNNSSEALSMLAFKCVYDPLKGFLVYVRIYSGTYQSKMPVFNRSLGIQEKPTKLMQVFGNSYEEVSELSAGSIGVIFGLKHTRTGDVLHSPFTNNHVAAPIIADLKIPPAVFFCSIEPESASEEEKMATSLTAISREDPSLQVIQDQESGQTLLAGIGELHLDIIQKRITRDFKVNAQFGGVKIGYRDRPQSLITGKLDYQREIGGALLCAAIELSVGPNEHSEDENRVDVCFESDGFDLVTQEAIKQALKSCLLCSPITKNPFTGTYIILKVNSPPNQTSLQAICQAIHALFRQILNDPSYAIDHLEPVMSLQIECPSEHLGTILTDLHSKRRATVHMVQSDPATGGQLIEADAPLAEILGYATYLRSVTQGHSSFSMDSKGYQLI